MKIVYWSLFLVFSFFASVLTAYSYNLRQISNIDNLSNSSIISLGQDSQGYIWIGTCDGLNIYNGRDVNVINPKDENNILPGSIINYILNTDADIIWTHTYYGLNKFNKKTHAVETFKEFSKVSIYWSKDKDDNLFVTTDDGRGIYLYSREKNVFEEVTTLKIGSNEIRHLFIDANNMLWVLLSNGSALCYSIRFDGNNCILKQESGYVHPTSIKGWFKTDEDIFIIDKNNRLYEMDVNSKKARLVFGIDEYINIREDITSVLRFEDDYFIGFKTKGLYKLGKQASKYSCERISINSGIFCLMKDHFQDIVWIGTDGKGVYSYSNDEYTINPTELGDHTYGMGRPIRSIYWDEERSLWIGNKGDGILKVLDYEVGKDILDCKVDRYTTSNSALKNNSVYAFEKSRKKILWIGGEDGLNYYSYKDKSIKAVQQARGTIDVKHIHDIYEQDSILWMTSVRVGVIKAHIKWNGDTPMLTKIEQLTLDNGDLASNHFFSFCVDGEYIYVTNRGKGVVKIDTQTSGMEVIEFDPDIINETYSIEKDGTDYLLVGTSFGLARYNMKKGSYQVRNKINGLPNNIIHCILPESENVFWLSTNQGVIKYNTENSMFRTFNYRTGLSVFEFSDGASFKDEQTGTLFFGGINGFVTINKTNFETKEYMPPINFDQLTVLGRDYNLSEFMTESNDRKVLTLNYDQNIFSIYYSAVDYQNGGNYDYYYMIEEVNRHWIANKHSNVIPFTDFSPGHYTLQVKYYNSVIDKDSPIYTIHIHILPPWYLSWWAYIIYSVLLLVALFLCLKWLSVRNKKKQIKAIRIMEQQHKEEIYESKLSFFTNIAHEFCTPLTLIYGPCSRILGLKNIDSSVTRYTHIIKQNAERLNFLIQDLIEFRRIDTGYKKPQIEHLDISNIIDRIAQSFIGTAEAQNIKLVNSTQPAIVWNSDSNFVVTIVSNLLSNAFKYSSNRGEVRVKTRLADDYLSIIVSNRGKGIKQDDIAKIFDRYRILDHFENQDQSAHWSRNGLGLAISYSMLTLLKGTIDIESVEDEWTHFHVKLPYLDINTEDTSAEVQVQIEERNVDNRIITSLPEYPFVDGKPTIMVLDDEMEILWFICDIFADEFNVIAANRVSDALKVLTDTHIDIILSDVMLPDVDGITFTRDLKNSEATAHIPLILISAKQEMEERIQGINAGAEMYITKPFNIDYLRTSIRQLLGRKQTLKNYFSSPISAFELTAGKLTHKEDKKLLKEIYSIIDKNIRNKDLSVDFIALKMNMSPRNLYRKVAEISEISIGDMIRDSRLNIAENLLLKSKLTIDQIIFRSGFANRVSFFRMFAKKYGCTPKEYRNQHGVD